MRLFEIFMNIMKLISIVRRYRNWEEKVLYVGVSGNGWFLLYEFIFIFLVIDKGAYIE